MKFILSWRLWTLIVLAFGALGVRADPPIVTFNVSVSTNQIDLNNSITYTFNLTNNVGINLQNVVVTNTFSSTVIATNAFPAQGSVYYATNSTNTIIFNLGTVSYLTNSAQFTLTVVPQALGLLTNSVVLTCFGTNVATTNLITQLINAQADLSVAITGFTPSAYVNDWLTYGITVSNAGPDNVSAVSLGNLLPPGLKLLSITPTDPVPTIDTNNVMSFSLGTLNSGSSQHFQLTVQPTNSGIYPMGVQAVAPGLVDPNTNNNIQLTNLFIFNYPSTALVAVTNSPQKLNPQNGLIEQSILVTNAGPGIAPAVRVVVSGLTNRLFNATGTNNGNPFVTSPGALAVNQQVNLLLQYYSASRSTFAFSNSQLQAEAVFRPNLTPPAAAGTSATNNAYILRQSNGNIMIEFPSVAGTNYTIVYADNVLFSNAMMILPSIKAPANWVQWVDYGPPATATHPTNTTQRYYRVFLNP